MAIVINYVEVMLQLYMVINGYTWFNGYTIDIRVNGIGKQFCLPLLRKHSFAQTLKQHVLDTKTSSLSETGQFMSSTYYVPVRNRKILASTYMYIPHERERASGSQEKQTFKIFHSIETTI